jgi:hypothetical protein
MPVVEAAARQGKVAAVRLLHKEEGQFRGKVKPPDLRRKPHPVDAAEPEQLPPVDEAARKPPRR